MKKKYTIQHIEQFFEEFKKLPNTYSLEQVHQLIHNPDAKATHKVTQNHHLKILIMTSAFLILLALLTFWLPKKQANVPDKQTSSFVMVREESAQPQAVNSDTFAEVREIAPNEVLASVPSKEAEPAKTARASKTDVTHSEPEKQLEAPVSNICSWPLDTLLDKQNMFVHLTNLELKKLGVTVKGNSVYYYNRTPNGKTNTELLNNWDGPHLNTTHFAFYVKHESDTACTTHRWGDPFYEQIDTLIPVVVQLKDDVKVLWFTPHPSIFEALPERYAYLENVLENLKCAKRKNPDHQFVNYWNPSRNIILDEIKSLELSNDELRNVGIQIFKDSVSIVESTNSFFYNRGKYKFEGGTQSINGSIQPDIPNMFPVLITDIKGLEQHSFGKWIKSGKEMTSASGAAFNTLIPVYFPLSKLVSNRKYDLIFWYYPSEDFVEALPERIKTDLALELKSIQMPASEPTQSCNYFEVCKSTLHLEDFKLYPNPTTRDVTLEFVTDENLEGTISMANVGGTLMKELVPKIQFLNGRNQFHINLGGVPPGIYIISVNTNRGFQTQRLVVAK